MREAVVEQEVRRYLLTDSRSFRYHSNLKSGSAQEKEALQILFCISLSMEKTGILSLLRNAKRVRFRSIASSLAHS